MEFSLAREGRNNQEKTNEKPRAACKWTTRDGQLATAHSAISTPYPARRPSRPASGLLGDESLADVSTWADEIRRKRKNTAPLHYANPAPGSDGFNLERDCVDSSGHAGP